VERDEYERMAATEQGHWWYVATRTLLAEQLAPFLPTGGRYLDAGGGTGATGAWLAAHGRLVATDLEPMALKLYGEGHPAVSDLAVADVAQLPFATGAFDLALAVTVLYHAAVASPAAAVGELARVVRPGGVVAVLEPGVRRLRRAHDRQTHAGRRFSRADLRRLLVDNGLDVVRATGAYTFLVPPAAVLALADRQDSSSDLDRDQGGLGGLLPVAARAERAVLRRAAVPFGLSVLAIGRVRR
jgi:ubiquinone/menaquinone biosynthesis C-methylase UbiE